LLEQALQVRMNAGPSTDCPAFNQFFMLFMKQLLKAHFEAESGADLPFPHPAQALFLRCGEIAYSRLVSGPELG
jgi:hypothetical protein